MQLDQTKSKLTLNIFYHLVVSVLLGYFINQSIGWTSTVISPYITANKVEDDFASMVAVIFLPVCIIVSIGLFILLRRNIKKLITFSRFSKFSQNSFVFYTITLLSFGFTYLI